MASAVGLAFLFFVFSCLAHFRLFTDSLLAIPINPQRRSGFPAVWFVHFGDISTLGFKPGLVPLLFNLSPKSAETPHRKEMQKPRGSCMPHRPGSPTPQASLASDWKQPLAPWGEGGPRAPLQICAPWLQPHLSEGWVVLCFGY